MMPSVSERYKFFLCRQGQMLDVLGVKCAKIVDSPTLGPGSYVFQVSNGSPWSLNAFLCQYGLFRRLK